MIHKEDLLSNSETLAATKLFLIQRDIERAVLLQFSEGKTVEILLDVSLSPNEKLELAERAEIAGWHIQFTLDQHGHTWATLS